MEKSNVNGGAIGELTRHSWGFSLSLTAGDSSLALLRAALGHPLAASGARITNNLVHTLHRLNKRYAVGSACIGGGQACSIVLERV